MPDRSIITITLFGEDSSFGARIHFREAVSSALSLAQLGEFVGGGSMVTDDPNYNIEFAVSDESQALAVISDTLRAESVGTATELLVREHRYKVYDDSWTDLGPRTKCEPPPADRFSGMSSGDFLADLKQIADDARKKYGPPKDPG